jgi:uncharacterized protein
MENETAAVVEFLSDGRAYGKPKSKVERLTTHAAEIFLVDQRAFKMKRAVRYSFLDFSHLAARRQALEAELELNRRTAPMIYRRVMPVTRDQDGRLVLGGEGQPIEWLLEMRRFGQVALLDRVAERGELDASLIDRLAQVVAHFHDQATVRLDHGGYAGMRQVIDGNVEDFARLVPGVFERGIVEELNREVRAELERRRDLLEQRRTAGQVRHCHGDLHLGNIVLLDGRPVLFDCLEFDEALACTDVVYDLAFVLMDLVHRRLGHLAQRLLGGWLDATLDDEGTALLPLFLSCRAAIRAKVLGFSADPASNWDEAMEEARNYLDLALGFLTPEPARLIAIGGLSGTGKSTLAAGLVPHVGRAPGAVVLRSDIARKRRFNAAPTERLAPEAYRAEVSDEVYRILIGRAGKLLAAGHTAIVDAAFLKPEQRAEAERVAQAAGSPFCGFWLEAAPGTLEARLAARRGDASDATPAVLRRQLEADPGPIGWIRLDAGGPPETVLEMALGRLGAPLSATGTKKSAPPGRASR